MVESKPFSGLGSMIKKQRLMTTMILFPYLNPWDLAIFLQVSKSCNALLDPKSKYCVNYLELFKIWGKDRTPSEVDQTKTSASRTLQEAAKWFIC